MNLRCNVFDHRFRARLGIPLDNVFFFLAEDFDKTA